MKLPPPLLGLPASLLVLIAAQVAAEPPRLPTAIRKMGLDSGEKFLPDYMAFEDEPIYAQAPLSPREAALAARLAREAFDQSVELPCLAANDSSAMLRPPFATHGGLDTEQSGWELVRRAAEALHLLRGRQSCPAGMSSCANIGEPNKCCLNGEVCVSISDPSVGSVACCPQGRTCTGTVGSCNPGSTSCPAQLGGGCCIPGYVCQGVGCKLLPYDPASPIKADD